MSTMSYCMFQNTRDDLEDCLNEISKDLSSDEHQARNDIYNMCHYFIKQYERNNLDEIEDNR